MKCVVSDTGPLISLEKLEDGYLFMRQLYDRMLVPPAVMKELLQGVSFDQGPTCNTTE